MTHQDALVRSLFGTAPKVRRMVKYWAATAVLYVVVTALLGLQVAAGLTTAASALPLAIYSIAGCLVFFGLVRCSVRLHVAPRAMAVLQGLFGVSCTLWLYAIKGRVGSAALVNLLVVVTFCTFAMRPRQTFILSTIALTGLAALMWWHVQVDPVHYPATIEALRFAFLAAGLLTVTVLTGAMTRMRTRLKRQKEELLAAVATIRTLATVDDLTALANRRYMNEVLAQEQRRMASDGAAESTCIALLDIDFFKRVNDRHGHAGGDAVLRAFAGAASAELRAADVLARWGGEEFLLMLPATALRDAQQVLARMAQQVAGMTVPAFATLAPVSFSAGVAARRPGEDFTATINRADKALYQAKAAGRNRIVVA